MFFIMLKKYLKILKCILLPIHSIYIWFCFRCCAERFGLVLNWTVGCDGGGDCVDVGVGGGRVANL